MTPDEIKLAIADGIVRALPNAIEDSIKVPLAKMQNNLNKHNMTHTNDMKRIMPVVEAWEATQTAGRGVLWVSGVIAAIGGAIITVMQIWPSIKMHL